MVTNTNVVLLDIGNSRSKWVYLDAPSAEPVVVNNLKATFTAWQKNQVRHLYVASVRDSTYQAQLKGYALQAGIQVRIIETEREAFGLQNSYENVSKMGADRWLAMLAAAELTDRTVFAVLDAGTAITCDFVADGKHLGGWIAPGFVTMRDGLVAATSRVFADDTQPTSLSLGSNTQQCVAHGCLAAVQGIMLSARAWLSAKYRQHAIIIGGGDKKLLTELEDGDSIAAANLVLLGLARYARRELSL